MKKILIVYYSWSNGNTERIAKALQSATGCNLSWSVHKRTAWNSI